jgi:hypothetical protein
MTMNKTTILVGPGRDDDANERDIFIGAAAYIQLHYVVELLRRQFEDAGRNLHNQANG